MSASDDEKIVNLITEKVYEAFNQGEYLVISEELLDYINNEMPKENADIVWSTIESLKRRSCGLLLKEFPEFTKLPGTLPLTPLGIPNIRNSCYINSIIQLFLLIDPIRRIYIYSNWSHGTTCSAQENNQTNYVEDDIETSDDGKRLIQFSNIFHENLSIVIRKITSSSSSSLLFGQELQNLRMITHSSEKTSSFYAYSQENVSEILYRIYASVDKTDNRLSPHPAFINAFKHTKISYVDKYGVKNVASWFGIAVAPKLPNPWRLSEDVLNVEQFDPDLFVSTVDIYQIDKIKDYLVFVLERGSYDPETGTSIEHKKCVIPHMLVLETNKGVVKLKLIAIVVRAHMSMTSGHYFVNALYPDGRWYRINDDHVSLLSDGAELENSELFEVLLYSKI